MWVSWQWWEQDGLYIEGENRRAAEEIGRRGGDKRGGGNPPRKDDGTGMRAGVQSRNFTY